MEDNFTSSNRTPTWQNCIHCPSLIFASIAEFERHIQNHHSVKQGSIILCQYSPNGICAGLQFGDLREDGFKYHVREYHLYQKNRPETWNYYCSSLNLPAVLNDPNRGKQSNFFTKTWGDHFVDKIEIHQTPFLPDITLHHFEPYCKKVAKKFKKHCRLKESNLAKVKITSTEVNLEIPNIFYEQSLQLHDPQVFSEVFPNLINSTNPISSIRLSQETLSTYLDVIEIRISKQVAEKSEAFFNAMLSHDTIMDDMAQAVKTVKKTRQNINEIKLNLSETPLKLICLTRVSTNLHGIQELLKLMSTVQQTQPMIQLLLSTSDYVAALDLISSTQKVLSSRLSKIQAFRHLSPQLTEMKRLIHKMLNNEFQKYLVANLNRPIFDDESLCDKDKLTCVVSGILRLKELDFVELLKTEVMTSVQTTIKQCVIEIISQRDSNTEVVLRGTNPDNHTSLLNSEGALFLQKVSPRIISLLRRIVFLISLIVEVTQMHDLTNLENEESWTSEELASVECSLNTILVSLSDYCNDSCSNLIMNKTDTTTAFNLTQLSELSQLVDSFTDECEAITGHSSSSMKLAIKSHAMQFIQVMHAESRSMLTNALNCERWKSCEVSSSLQCIVNKMSQNHSSSNVSTKTFDKSDSKYLIIGNENYAVVGTVQLLIKILFQYCEAIQQPYIVAQYLIHCMLELIRLFNSRCCQLVLGAGAIQSAGLKTISTSNLALVSRSLQLLLWLLPNIKSFLQNLNSNEMSFNGLDNIENDLLSHKQEIEQKICIIVSDMLCSQLAGWDAKPPVPSQTFRNISKHLVKLHEALIDILPIEQITLIYKKVHDNFKDKLRDQLIQMNIVANGSPQHGVVTSELTFYLQTLKTLRVIKDNGVEDNILYDVWLN